MNELIFASSDPAQSRQIHRRLAAGELREVATRIYSSNLTDPLEAVVRRNLFPIIGHRFPGAVISHRSALKPEPTATGAMYLTWEATSARVDYPGLTLFAQNGRGPLPDDTPFLSGLHLASPARALLENLQRTRITDKGGKTMSAAELEHWLDRLIQLKGAGEINRLRDEAKRLAPILGMDESWVKLNSLIGALMGTAPSSTLKSAAGKARSLGQPYDTDRVAGFSNVIAWLAATPLPNAPDPLLGKPAQALCRDFYDAYFTNYIEGTEFVIEEAEQIVFHAHHPVNRPKDAHDITASFALLQNQPLNRPQRQLSAEEWITLIRSWHQTLMAGREEVSPGNFKTRANRVGDRNFVSPELVEGTLYHAYDLANVIRDPFALACYWKLVLTEVHPFNDGNGRVSRLILNHLLKQAGLCPIIIPTVYRIDYLTSLTAFTQTGKIEPFIQALTKAQEFTGQVDFNDLETTKADMERRRAFSQPHEARLVRHGLPKIASIQPAAADLPSIKTPGLIR
jgi:hypothetical protein